MARTGEIDVTYRPVRDQGRDDGRCILWRVHHNVDGSLRESRRDKDFAKQAVCAGADFRRLEDDTVATGERPDDRSHTENEGRVPGRDGETNADRLPYRKREAARLVGCQNLANNAGGGRRRFSHDAFGEMNVESRPRFRCARFIHHRGDQVVGPVSQEVGGAPYQLSARGGSGLRPLHKSCGCGIRGSNGIGFAGRGCGGHYVPGHRVTAREGPRRHSRRAIDQKRCIEHDVVSPKSRIDFKPCLIDRSCVSDGSGLRRLVVEMRNLRVDIHLDETRTRCLAGILQRVLQFVGLADATPRAAKSCR
jgi:hypothetical protein